MGIGEYLRRKKCSVDVLAERTGISRTTLYRWRSEEEACGFVRGIDADGLRRLFEGTGGAIKPADVIGAQAVAQTAAVSRR